MKRSLSLSMLCCGLLLAPPMQAAERLLSGGVADNSTELRTLRLERKLIAPIEPQRADEPIDEIPEDAAAHSARREPTMTEAEAARRARQQHGGRVLAVRWTGRHYQVKLLREGEVRTVNIVE